VALLIVEQQADAPAGLVAEWAAARGHAARTVSGRELDELRPGAWDAIVPLGSDRSVHASREDWIARQVRALRAAHHAGTPVLGLCFGAQALAAALGGRVERAPRPEIGWVEVEVVADGAVGPGPWFSWHEDRLALPPGADELARTPLAPQAFRAGRSVGLQFHPEVTPAIVARWLDGGREQLIANGIDGDALRRRTESEAAAARERAFSLFDAVAAQWE
jgi:GMP synthase-like glutamine amidotransferase